MGGRVLPWVVGFARGYPGRVAPALGQRPRPLLWRFDNPFGILIKEEHD